MFLIMFDNPYLIFHNIATGCYLQVCEQTLGRIRYNSFILSRIETKFTDLML